MTDKEPFRVVVTWHSSGRPDSIWNKLKEKLGRDPTKQEAADEVRRILNKPRD